SWDFIVVSSLCALFYQQCCVLFQKNKKGKKSAGSSEVVSAATVSSVHSAAPPASTSVSNGGKEMDEALDLLSDSLGQREPDPDENKPIVDKVKEKAKSEHRDKLGEREDTIPPDARKLLESGEQVSQSFGFFLFSTLIAVLEVCT
uniref:Calpastatin n=1 Tax=Nothoprocta perdicaria TaxID=30464 RepID=A0A8C6ZV18_NOTPE